jgi:iron complex outermembrane receptor protein
VRAAFVAAVTLLLSTTAVWAQSSLSGRVVDPQGSAVVGADVFVISAGAPARGTRSSGDGSFTFGSLPAGTYELLVVAPGFADDTQPVTVGATPATVDVELQLAGITADITVQGAMTGTITTGKTNLPLRDLPMTVNRVSGQAMAEQGVTDLVGALNNATGVNSYRQYGIYEGYTFRGFQDLFPPTAAQLLDGVRNETTNRINTQLTNIERIEVLKGPASALYGGGSLGATVNLIRKKPSLTPAYDFSGSVGRWESFRGTFGATGRLASDRTLYRLDVGTESKEGYRHNETRRFSVTPSLAWRIGDRDQLNIYFTFNRDQFAGDAGIPLIDTDTAGTVDSKYPTGVPRDRNFRTPQDEALSFDNNFQATYARQLNDSFGFRNTISYRHLNDGYFIVEYLAVEPPSDVYREFLQFKHHRRPVTNQAEFTANLRGRVEQNIVAGWEVQRYYNHTDTIPDGGVAEAEYIDLYNPIETQQAIDPPIARIRHFEDWNNAFYVQDHLSFGRQVKAMAGGRFDIYRHHRYDRRPDGGTPAPDRRRELEALTGRLGLVYQPVPNVDLFGAYATSFQPLLNEVNPDGSTLDPLTGRQVEFGQRFHLAGGRIDVNTAVFHQVRENYPLSRPGGIYDQAGEISSKGFELDITSRLTSNVRIDGGYAFTDAEYGDFRIDETTNLRGTIPVFAPRHTLNVWTSYDFANGFGASVGVRALSRQYGDLANMFEIGGYGLLNAAIRYTRGPVEYAVNINNITDTKYYASTLYDTQVYPGEPVNVLATVRVRVR